jgi:hypothetical protein
MSTELVSWPRPHFAPGGGSAQLYYDVFGTFDLEQPLSGSKYRCAGTDWLGIHHCDRGRHPDVFLDTQPGPLWEVLKGDASHTAELASKAPQMVALRGEVADADTLDYFRDAIGVVAWLLDVGGVAVCDPQMLRLWSAEEWRAEAFEPNEPQPLKHTVILDSPEGGTNGSDGAKHWLHTRGMLKFGRPDLSVRGVGPGHLEVATELIARFIVWQARGGVIREGEAVRIPGLPPGGVCRHRGSPDDPDFNNVHVAIEWDDGAIGT